MWQFSSSFLEGISTHVDPKLPFISLSKGLELNTLRTMSQIIPQALGNPRQPFIVLSGPSFAIELMNKLPTGLVRSFLDKFNLLYVILPLACLGCNVNWHHFMFFSSVLLVFNNCEDAQLWYFL